jgi:hypothetical protein
MMGKSEDHQAEFDAFMRLNGRVTTLRVTPPEKAATQMPECDADLTRDDMDKLREAIRALPPWPFSGGDVIA